jgi:hypothetical protein
MKSIKANPNSAKGPDKGKIVNKCEDSNIYPRNIHTFIRPSQWTHSAKRLRMCEIVCWRKSTWHKQKHWWILHENDTKRRIQQVLSIICNAICLQFSLYRVPLQSLGLLWLISSRISDFKNALPNEFTVKVVWMYEYFAGKYWSLHWMEENQTATYF